jgi:tripartite-type tricarboxylate transporter receptor subunit TctC
MSYRQFFKCLAVALLLAAGPSVVSAQSFPARAITIILPFPPGGVSDTSLRLIAAKIAENTGQQVIVDNRPGAGGLIGAELVKRAAPDGYTLYVSNIGSHAINEALYSKLPY